MKTILVPTDFHAAAENAMAAAVKLAKNMNAKINLMTMFKFPKFKYQLVESAVYSEEEYYALLKEDAEREIKRWQEWYPEVKIEGIIEEDFEDLIPAILSEGADLIVMGSEGANGWKDYFSGTNAQNVVRKADCPVLVMKENTSFEKIENVLFVTDFEKTGFIEVAQNLFNLENTNNKFLFVDAGEITDDRAELYDTARDIEKLYDIKNFDFEIYKHDSIAKGTVEFAQSRDIDLIIMFTHGRKGFERFLFGSIAEEVVNISEIPVLSILE
ncbi:universal stress protein [Lacihabitans sp. LS3-19]|uniref:universal stress protein n=1 Tax=Lacihabitans sp. LS3-19 TaxID=2487335 RepID=UPI0020CBA6E5|nr:universal stress protein [Lacihabitans sp. LS3-19]MCP9770068.1 universal stress protein [Lacihabitans sp. LS3-19]